MKDALPHVRRLIELEPENTQSKELLTQIEKNGPTALAEVVLMEPPVGFEPDDRPLTRRVLYQLS